MKKLLNLLFFLTISCTMFAQFNIGGGAQFVTDSNRFGLQAKTKLGISEKVTLAGTGTLYLGTGSRFGIDVDAHYLLATIGDGFMFSGVGGVNILTGAGGGIQLNLGTSLDFIISERRFYIEPKIIIEKNVAFVVSAGVYLFR